MEYFRLDPETGRALLADEASATHVPVEQLRNLQALLEAERDRNKRIYEKLQREVGLKLKWRDRCRVAEGLGEKPAREGQERGALKISRVDCRRGTFQPVGIGYLPLSATNYEDAYADAVAAAAEYSEVRRDSRDAQYESGCKEVEVDSVFVDREGVWTAVLRWPMTAAAKEAEANWCG